MRTIIQRVEKASVTVDGEIVGKIAKGLLIFAGFEECDTDTDLLWMVRKITRMRIFSDQTGVMNHSVIENGGNILVVSQFTLYASVKKGNRPSWSRAAKANVSQPLFEQFVELLQVESGKPVATGLFGADMAVSLLNDGPVTIAIDSRNPD